MPRDTVIVCGGADPPRRAGRVLRLSLSGAGANVHLHIEDICRPMVGRPPDFLADLLEIAAYVHCADQLVSRGGKTAQDLGSDWRRQLRFVVPVRDLHRWSSEDVSGGLERLLSFMSDDVVRFEFVQAREPPSVEGYLDFREETGDAADEVLLFSGGMDSLTGAVDRLCLGTSRALLVSHQSSTKIADRQHYLAAELARRFPSRVLHVPVRLTKHGLRSVETSQRTRSFLFGALAGVVSVMSGGNRFKLFENGIVSFNLPIAGQVVGTAATRTTHPRVVKELEHFLSTLASRQIEIHNPFLWQTKTEVADRLRESNHADLAPHSVSCSHVYEMTRMHTHCGRCSQCLDRRFGALAAGLGENDPSEMYETDLLTGERAKDEDRAMAESFVRHALELQKLSNEGFLQRFAGEIGRAARCVPAQTADEVAKNLIELHRRHSEAVRSVLEDGYRRHAQALAGSALPASCILRLVAGPVGVSLPYLSGKSIQAAQTDDLRDYTRSSEIRLALDVAAKRLLIGGMEPIEGPATFKLVERLVREFEKDRAALRAPENYNYLSALVLAKALEMDEASLRRAVYRLRRRVADAYLDGFGLTLSSDALIESRSWRGYRLNPAIVLVARGELATIA